MIFSKQMATKQLITAEQYLATPYEREPEFVHGELVERSLPTFPHGNLHARLSARLLAMAEPRGLFLGVEVRIRIAADVYRIPDIAMWESAPGDVPDAAPLLVVEILSPDDRLTSVREKLEEYRAWGVKHVWLVDPYLRRMYTCDAGLAEVASLQVAELDAVLAPVDIFE